MRSLTSVQEHKLQMSKNKVQRKLFETWNGEMCENFMILHNE